MYFSMNKFTLSSIENSLFDSNMNWIKIKAKEAIEQEKGEKVVFEEEPIAFGLKAVIARFDLNEDFELDPIETALSDIEEVNSAQVIDMRRAFG